MRVCKLDNVHMKRYRGLSWHLVENDYHQWKLKFCSVLCGFQSRTISTHDVVARSVIWRSGRSQHF